jgi:hypothetical protein
MSKTTKFGKKTQGILGIELESPKFTHQMLGLSPYKLRVGVAMIHVW